MSDMLTIAVPKGRIAKELLPLLAACGVEPEPAFFDSASRQLIFATNNPQVQLTCVRSFDVPTFVALGGAQLGVAGHDVLLEHDYPELFTPLNLGIGRCRMCLAAPNEVAEAGLASALAASHIRVATKYTAITQRYFAKHGVQAECIKLHGAMEIAPLLGMAPYIVDLVSSGATLKANGMAVVDTLIPDISAKLLVHRATFAAKKATLSPWIEALEANMQQQATQE